jgi:plastocyanin
MRTFAPFALCPALACLPAGAALAATPTSTAAAVQVLDMAGRPLAGAVVTLAMPGVAAPAPRGPYVMAQRGIAFEPRLLIVPVGATVAFPNFDKVRHHVYSFSPARKFDLKLFGRDETRSVAFPAPGAVALGCNIHDAMNGIVYVTASPYTAATGADGRVRFALAAGGPGTLSVWHPSIRANGNAVAQRVIVPAGGFATTVQLRR